MTWYLTESSSDFACLSDIQVVFRCVMFFEGVVTLLISRSVFLNFGVGRVLLCFKARGARRTLRVKCFSAWANLVTRARADREWDDRLRDHQEEVARQTRQAEEQQRQQRDEWNLRLAEVVVGLLC